MQKYKVVVTIPAIIAYIKPFRTVAKTHMYRRCTSVNSLPETDYKKKITVLCKEAVV